MKKVFYVLILLLSFNIAQAAGTEETATGFGPNKREALMAAQRTAVEKGVGVLVDSRSLSENMVLVEDKIYTKARGYVNTFTVISERRLTDGNWEVVIKCDVADEKIKHSLKALGILRDKMGNPRIMVVYDPESSDGLSRPQSVGSEAYDGIVEHLTEREFPVVARQELDLSILKESGSSNNSYAKTGKLVKLGLSKKAEYILVYRIESAGEESTGIFKKRWVMLSAKIINTSSGQILANQSKKVIGVDKDSSDFALRKAGRKAGKLAAKFLENKLVKRWQGDSVSGRVVVLEVVNIEDFSVLVEFKAQLKHTYGVRNIFQRNSNSNKAEYEITYVGDIDTLKENAHTILKKIGVKPKSLISDGDKISIELPAK
jgi:hypothetical protein